MVLHHSDCDSYEPGAAIAYSEPQTLPKEAYSKLTRNRRTQRAILRCLTVIMTSTTTSSTFKLAHSHQYHDWELQLRQRLDPTFWTSYIDPESLHRLDLPTEPTPPNPRGFPYTPAYTRELQVYNEARNEEPPRLLEMPLFALSCLTLRGREAYDLVKSEYSTLLPLYKEYNKMNLRARQLVSESVDKCYLHCLSPQLSVREWITNLRQQCSQTTDEMRIDARREYRRILEQKDTQMKKDGLLTWLSQWERTMANGIDKGVAETLEPSAWIEDFLTAWRRVLPEWSKIYGLTRKQDVLNGRCTYRDVSRDAATEVTFSQATAGPWRAGRGAFSISEGTSSVTDRTTDTSSEQEREGRTGNRGRGGGQTRGQGRGLYAYRSRDRSRSPSGHGSTTRERRGPPCRACNRPYHKHKECFYAVPSLRPSDWIPDSYTLKVTQVMLREDETLRLDCEEAEKQAKERQQKKR